MSLVVFKTPSQFRTLSLKRPQNSGANTLTRLWSGVADLNRGPSRSLED